MYARATPSPVQVGSVHAEKSSGVSHKVVTLQIVMLHIAMLNMVADKLGSEHCTSWTTCLCCCIASFDRIWIARSEIEKSKLPISMSVESYNRNFQTKDWGILPFIIFFTHVSIQQKLYHGKAENTCFLILRLISIWMGAWKFYLVELYQDNQ